MRGAGYRTSLNCFCPVTEIEGFRKTLKVPDVVKNGSSGNAARVAVVPFSDREFSLTIRHRKIIAPYRGDASIIIHQWGLCAAGHGWSRYNREVDFRKITASITSLLFLLSASGGALFLPGQAFAAVTTVVRTTGTSYALPSDVISVKVWAIGGGGGGGGCNGSDGCSAGSGGGGGVEYQTYSVSGGETVTYSVGAGGTGGTNTANGSAGATTTATISGVTISAGGGGGGLYNASSPNTYGGWHTGGDGGATGGVGKAMSGDNGGGGGAGIGGTAGTQDANENAGGTGAAMTDVSGLSAAVTAAGYSTGAGGANGTSAGGNNDKHGSNATTFGAGGGGAGWYGGNGGNGYLGGGGGGAAGLSANNMTGGTGGSGVVVIQYDTGAAECTLTSDVSTVAPGESATLTWTTASANSASIDNGIGTVTPTAGG